MVCVDKSTWPFTCNNRVWYPEKNDDMVPAEMTVFQYGVLKRKHFLHSWPFVRVTYRLTALKIKIKFWFIFVVSLNMLLNNQSRWRSFDMPLRSRVATTMILDILSRMFMKSRHRMNLIVTKRYGSVWISDNEITTCLTKTDIRKKEAVLMLT